MVVPILIEGAGQGKPEARAEAVNGLGFYARKSEPARRALFAALGDPDVNVQFRAVHSLGYVATYPDLAPEPLLTPIMAAVEKAADDESPIVRMAAVYVLGDLASRTRVENPRVIEALRDPDAMVRQQAAIRLSWWGRSGKRSPALVPALILALKDQDTVVRQASASTLGGLGTDAEAALPALRDSASDPDKDVREKAERAITGIEKAGRDAHEAFAKALAELGDADPDVRALAADWFGGAGPKGAEAIPALVRCLSDREADVRRSAANALGQLGPGAAMALPTLTTLAESDLDERVRQAATLSRAILLRRPDGEAQGP